MQESLYWVINVTPIVISIGCKINHGMGQKGLNELNRIEFGDV